MVINPYQLGIEHILAVQGSAPVFYGVHGATYFAGVSVRPAYVCPSLFFTATLTVLLTRACACTQLSCTLDLASTTGTRLESARTVWRFQCALRRVLCPLLHLNTTVLRCALTSQLHMYPCASEQLYGACSVCHCYAVC